MKHFEWFTWVVNNDEFNAMANAVSDLKKIIKCYIKTFKKEKKKENKVADYDNEIKYCKRF